MSRYTINDVSVGDWVKVEEAYNEHTLRHFTTGIVQEVLPERREIIMVPDRKGLMDKIRYDVGSIVILKKPREKESSEMNKKKVASELVKVAKELVGMRFPQMERKHYLPKNADKLEQVEIPEELGLEIWRYESNGSIYGIAFQGRAQKPLWHYRFRNEVQFMTSVNKEIESRKSRQEYKQKQKEERSQFQHTLKEGDILYSSWGYDQTNVDWYEVTEVLDKSVILREVGSKVVRGEMGAEYVVPVSGKYTGTPIMKRVSQGNSVKIKSYANAYLWDGKPKYETAAGWGH